MRSRAEAPDDLVVGIAERTELLGEERRRWPRTAEVSGLNAADADEVKGG